MLRPSLVLTLLTAMFTADTPTASATASSPTNTQGPPTLSTPAGELSEKQRIVSEARRSIGSELCKL